MVVVIMIYFTFVPYNHEYMYSFKDRARFSNDAIKLFFSMMLLLLIFKAAHSCFHYNTTCQVAIISEVFGHYKPII